MIHSNFKATNKGFTLIEILVVIAIIGLMSSIVLASLNTARAKARDSKRIADINNIQKAVEAYIDKYGTLPRADSYGEDANSPGFWDGWWDISSFDKNGDGDYFMDFLKDEGLFTNVPVDPLNTPATDNIHEGYRYVYFIANQGYTYQGGTCVVNSGDVYLIGIRDLETKSVGEVDSRCDCIWQNSPDFFSGNFDYAVCNSY